MSLYSTKSANPMKELLVCFSHLRWGFVFQRPQHLMTLAARRFRIIFWEEPLFEVINEPRLARFPQKADIEVITPILPEGMAPEQVKATLRSLLDRLLEEKSAGAGFLAWYITPMMIDFTEHLKPVVTIYDKMDELAAFKDAPSELKEQENTLLARADVVFAGGQSIYEASRSSHRNIHPFPSSIDQEHFASYVGRASQEPLDQIAIPRPRIGWFGVIDERMDLDLLAGVARLRPDWQFVMLGPVVKIDPSSLPRLPNIRWLGSKNYSDLPLYLSGWNAGIIPFAMNESTRFISPTKTPEFLAAGVPVAATPIKDIVRPYGILGLVSIARGADEMVSALAGAMAMPREPWMTQVRAFLADKSWEATWRGMEGLIQASLQNHHSQGKAA